jgi:hypothetical protein
MDEKEKVKEKSGEKENHPSFEIVKEMITFFYANKSLYQKMHPELYD